ncbi:hypothetical protein GW17_00061749 [Ensete ventricosum]|nr:hypothetical protein GW17_00061749 [Ensete ventricosum]
MSCEGHDHAKMKILVISIWGCVPPREKSYFIDPLLSWRESIGRKRGRGGGECRGKLRVPRHGRRAEAKKLHKTGIDGLLIKIAESEGLRVDAGVLDQGTK